MYVCLYVCMCAYTCDICRCRYMHLCMYARMYTYIYINMFKCVCIHAYMYIKMYVCTHVWLIRQVSVWGTSMVVSHPEDWKRQRVLLLASSYHFWCWVENTVLFFEVKISSFEGPRASLLSLWATYKAAAGSYTKQVSMNLNLRAVPSTSDAGDSEIQRLKPDHNGGTSCTHTHTEQHLKAQRPGTIKLMQKLPAETLIIPLPQALRAGAQNALWTLLSALEFSQRIRKAPASTGVPFTALLL